MNKVFLLGRLGKDPELRKTGNGNSVCSFSLATSKKWKDKDGTKQEKTEWHRVVVWGPSADNCSKYLSKGSQVLVDGEIRYSDYDDKDGVKKYVTDINANHVQFLDTKKKEEGAGSGGAFDEPIPF